MLKEFKISDILSAVNSISKIERKKAKTVIIKKNLAYKENTLEHNNQVKSNKGEILVLDQMIE